MKKLIPLLCLVFLAGCAEPVETQPTTQTTPPSSAVETTVPETTAVETTLTEPEDGDFVCVTDYIPGIVVDLKYATEDNFTGQVIYAFQDAYLRYGTVKKLAAVQEALEVKGLSLKIWDAFRPTWAQFRLWEICPDPQYVSNPNKGFSSHSRGNTLDVTIVDSQGREVEMPTGFDDFSKLADRDYSDCTPIARENALLLEELMKEAGFKPYSGEWWHFTDETAYDVEMDFLSQ